MDSIIIQLVVFWGGAVLAAALVLAAVDSARRTRASLRRRPAPAPLAVAVSLALLAGASFVGGGKRGGEDPEHEWMRFRLEKRWADRERSPETVRGRALERFRGHALREAEQQRRRSTRGLPPARGGGGYYEPGLTRETVIRRLVMSSRSWDTPVPRLNIPEGRVRGYRTFRPAGDPAGEIELRWVGQDGINKTPASE